MIWNAFVKVFVDHDNANIRSREKEPFWGFQGNVKQWAEAVRPAADEKQFRKA